MLIDRPRASSLRRVPLSRIRYQLGLGLLVACVLPYVLRISLADPQGDIDSAAALTLVVSSFAVAFAYALTRSLSGFPGAKELDFTVPALTITFATAGGLMLLLRLDYSRSLFIGSYALAVAWFVSVYSYVQSRLALRIGVLPFGQVEAITEIATIVWEPLHDPAANIDHLDGVVADFRVDMSDEWERALADWALNGKVVYHAKQLSETLTGRVDLEHLSENNFGTLVPLAAYLSIKRVVDLAIAIALLPLFAVIIGVCAILIRLDSRGPSFFTQRRMGYRGRPFTVYKLRTMRVAEDAGNERRAAMTGVNDNRVTRLGRFLRRTRIDELPQILNVLIGNMSWIGPRPEALALSLWYESELPFYRYRHIVLPGISGWAQVNQGHVSEIDDVREKLQRDFYYIKFFSPWLDIIIFIRTAMTVVTGFGAR